MLVKLNSNHKFGVFLTLPCCHMDMSCDYKHGLVVHGYFASEVVAVVVVIAVDGSAIASEDSNIHFDCENHPKDTQ